MKRITEAQMRRRVKAWQKRLGLTGWRLTIQFGVDEEEGSEASCLAMPEYGMATLRFDLAKIEPDELDAYVVHELMHCPIWRLANLAHSMAGDDAAKLEAVRMEEESLATHLERLVVHTLAVEP